MKLAPVQPGAFIGSEKESDLRHMAGIETKLQGLQVEELLVELGREPELLLSISQNSAGHDTVHADACRTEFARQRASHAVDGCLGGGVADHAGTAPHPGDRSQA